MKIFLPYIAGIIVLTSYALGQTANQAPPQNSSVAPSPGGAAAQQPIDGAAKPDAIKPPPDYVLGTDDQLTLVVSDLTDEYTDKTFRIDNSGQISLPFTGRIQAGGLTIPELEQSVTEHLTHVLKDPQVVISIIAFGSQPASVLGSVNTPGLVQLQGKKNLFQVLSLAGGLSDDAGYAINITRQVKWGPIPLANAHLDATGQYSLASVRVKDILDSGNTLENIIILPYDSISVPKADLVYAVGYVMKPGGFVLNQHESLSALQVVSLAEGFQRTAAPDRAKILRAVPGSPSRVEIAVNLKKLMAGTGGDVQLRPDDILFVPNSAAKSVAYRSIDAIVQASVGVAVYGKY